MDDPLVWGVLPFRYLTSPENLRWILGSHDICFKNKSACFCPTTTCTRSNVLCRATSSFFTLGQVLPTHRLAHSTHGGLFQPTMTQTVRLLSHGPFHTSTDPSKPVDQALSSPDLSDPFSSPHLTYST